MDFDFSEGQEAFRKEVRQWLEQNLPESLRGRGFAASRSNLEEVAQLRAWQRRMYEAGYVGMDWPREFGGRGAPRVEQIILEELAKIQESGPTEDERQLAVTKFESEHAFSVETSEGLAYAYGIAETTWTLEEELRYVDRLRQVTREQIRDAARRFLSRSAYARLAFLPRPGAIFFRNTSTPSDQVGATSALLTVTRVPLVSSARLRAIDTCAAFDIA